MDFLDWQRYRPPMPMLAPDGNMTAAPPPAPMSFMAPSVLPPAVPDPATPGRAPEPGRAPTLTMFPGSERPTGTSYVNPVGTTTSPYSVVPTGGPGTTTLGPASGVGIPKLGNTATPPATNFDYAFANPANRGPNQPDFWERAREHLKNKNFTDAISALGKSLGSSDGDGAKVRLSGISQGRMEPHRADGSGIMKQLMAGLPSVEAEQKRLKKQQSRRAERDKYDRLRMGGG